MMKAVSRFLSLVVGLIILSLGQTKVSAQMVSDAVKWQKEVKQISDSEFDMLFTATIGEGWHLYGTDIPEGGPQKTELKFDTMQGVELVGSLKANKKAITKYDEMFEMEIAYFEHRVSFVQRFKITQPQYKIEAYVRYMVCNDGQCLPPTNFEFSLDGKGGFSPVNNPEVAKPAVEEPKPTIEEPQSNQIAIAEDIEKAQLEGSDSDLWTPVIPELKALGDSNQNQANSSLIMIFISGFLGGLLALLTPCVWPMIPMTVSFFLKRTKDRKQAIRDAFTYALSIVVIYVVVGLLVSIIFGASFLNKLSSDPIFNLVFFLILVVFAISFFGAFEIVLPASWVNKMDEKADKSSGLLSILFMASTLVLVSFSCTGPIIGTLLVEAATKGSLLAPAMGMFGFALALALPFGLFALFPNMLQSMPKSGGWLNSVKVVLAFLELALAFKFLASADQAGEWHIFERESFIAIWVVIFALLGMYLLGKLRFPHDTPKEHTSVLGLFLAMLSLSFAVYLVPGLWGAPLRSISAFTPPLSTQDFNLYNGSVHAKFDDYEAGMAYAKQHNKPVFLDFSGKSCTNCRKMESSVWSNEAVKPILENDYVLITLMVDATGDLPEPIIVNENGKEVKLRTVGDKWSYLQRVKFGANAQPYYVALDHEGKPLTPSRGYDEDVKEYINFLKGGLKRFKAQQEQ